jgi:beta-galactosidase
MSMGNWLEAILVVHVGFHIDISDFIFKGKKNTLAIRVDNSIDRDIIPSQKADFYIYGGIIRDLWLKIIPAEHMDNIKVSTPVVNKNSAQTKVELNLNNLHHQENAYQLKYSIAEKVSKKIIVESEQVISASQAVSISVLPDVISPLLWSPDDPNLYILNIKLFKKGN